MVKPDGLLPGENLRMASSSGDSATVVKSGTSFAAPIAAAILALHYEAVAKQVVFLRELTGHIVGYPITSPISVQRLMEFWLPRICIKPDFAPLGKDNDYGYGIPYAGYMAEAISTGLGGTAGTEQITAMIAPVMSIALMGAFVSGITRELARV
jgi:serine protease AprX